MLLSLDASLSALDQFQQELDVLGNNIANVNTVGFKSSNVTFATALSQTLGDNSAGTEQIGEGVLTGSIAGQFTQGTITNTGVQSNMAINGNGFFLVKDPTTQQEYVTRDGSFTVDPNGYLVTSTGLRVQGYTSSADTTVGDIQISNVNAPGGDTAAVKSYSFDSSGQLTITLADGTPSYISGQILLQNFNAPTQLTSVGDNLYSGLASAGPLTNPVAPGTSGVGILQTSSLELSNVDLASQLTSLITTQRAYEANSRVVSTSDQILQTLVNLGH
jgi:flagellar hook protein FlgE